MNRKLIAAVTVAAMSMGLFVNGCDEDATSTGTQRTEEKQTEDNQQRLAASTPPPQFTTSLERENLVKRLERLNVQNKIGYVYLIGMGGEVVANYTVKGKVSSLNSFLTTPQQVVQRWVGSSSQGHYEGYVVDSPDFDGSYGKNPDGIFFFTTDDTLVEWQGQFLYADKPLRITTPVKLEANVDLEKRGQ